MARITYDGQSFSLDNRRIWLVGANLDYARIHPAFWVDRIAAVKQAGFNMVYINCPWLVHEPRKGRFSFTGHADVKTFVAACVEAGLYVGLKVGPYVGAGYDGGGLPSWLGEVEGIAMRENNAPYLERVGMYLRKLLTQLTEFQIDKAGGDRGVICIQAEHGWLCTKDDVADAYLGELEKHIRENGFSVPVLNANTFWAEGRAAIETWVGFDDLLPNLRQMRAFQPNAPRIVSGLTACEPGVWGDSSDDSRPADVLLYAMAQVLAAGAQPVVSQFHGGTNFGFLSGRIAGRDDGFITTAPALHAPLGEAGARGSKYNAVKRLATFANAFGQVFAELDPDYQPVTLSLDHIDGSDGHGATGPGARGVAVVPLRGAQGRINFVFGDPKVDGQRATLLLDHGIPIPLNLGDQGVGWYLIDVDLGGKAWLDYTNLCPFALVDRSILVVFGPERMDALLSINESIVEVSVPSGQKPRIVEHQDITIVICNEAQIDATYFDAKNVYVGISGFDADGKPTSHADFPQATVVSADGNTSLKLDPPPKKSTATRLPTWSAAPAVAQSNGSSPRYASLAGPETLDSCGTPAGYGWYRVKMKSPDAKKRLCAIPRVGNRMQFFVDGESQTVLGTGPGATGYLTEIKCSKGEHTLVGLVDHSGRFSEGNDFGRRKGWYGHMYEVKPLKVGKPKIEEREPVDPFLARNFLLGQSQGRMLSETQAVWTFTHRKKSQLLVHVEACDSPGIFMLNDTPLAFYAGESGERAIRFLVNPELDFFKRGANELRFAPDPDYADAAATMAEAVTIYECVDNLTENASWSFARWEQPPHDAFEALSAKDAKACKGTPAWWHTTFEVRKTTLPKWFDTNGLSKGVVFINGENVGRYFTATADGKKVGPQTRLYLPEPWLNADGENDITVFDEHGFHPGKTRILYADHGEFEQA